MKYVVWFEVGIKGKDALDQEEEDWGGKIKFGFSDKNFSTEIEDYILLFEDKFDQSHACAGRVMGVAYHLRDKVIKPRIYTPETL